MATPTEHASNCKQSAQPAMLPCRCRVSRVTTGPNTLTYHYHPWMHRQCYKTQTSGCTPSQHMTSMHRHNAQSQLAASQSMVDGSISADTSISATRILKSQLRRKERCHNAATVASSLQNHMRPTRLANSACGDNSAIHKACSHNKSSRFNRAHLCFGLATLNLPPLPHSNTWDTGWRVMTMTPWQ